MPRKKAYLVMPRTTAITESGLTTGRGTLKFKKGKTSMMVGDETLAHEIDTQHGLKGTGDVWVAEDQRAESFLRDDGPVGVGVHRYFWGSSPRFSSAWEEFEKRRKDKSETDKNAYEENASGHEKANAANGDEDGRGQAARDGSRHKKEKQETMKSQQKRITRRKARR